MAPNWIDVARICDNEVSRASSSRADRAQAMKRPGAKVQRETKEHDEFLAKKLVFARIARICRMMDAKVIPERIEGILQEPDLLDPDILDRDAFAGHWAVAYEFALDQCGIRQDVP